MTVPVGMIVFGAVIVLIIGGLVYIKYFYKG